MRERSSRPDRKYAAIPNEAMRDKRLSAEARGVLAYLMTFSDDWTFHRDKVLEDMNLGRDRFQRLMGELKDAGYVQLQVVRADNGGLMGTTWVIRDEPDCNTTESLKTRSSAESLKTRQSGNPTDGKSGPLRRPTGKNTNLEENQSLFPCEAIPVIAEKQDRFDEFWQAFPSGRKTAKPQAHASWLRIISGKAKDIPKTDAETIIAAVRRFAASGPDPQFVPMPSTWLNGARWDQWAAPAEADRPKKFVYYPGGVEQ